MQTCKWLHWHGCSPGPLETHLGPQTLPSSIPLTQIPRFLPSPKHMIVCLSKFTFNHLCEEGATVQVTPLLHIAAYSGKHKPFPVTVRREMVSSSISHSFYPFFLPCRCGIRHRVPDEAQVQSGWTSLCACSTFSSVISWDKSLAFES